MKMNESEKLKLDYLIDKNRDTLQLILKFHVYDKSFAPSLFIGIVSHRF